ETFDCRCDWQNFVTHAERLGTGSGVVEGRLRGEPVGQHQTAHPVLAQGINRHRCAYRGINASRQTQHDTRKTVLVHVVAKTQHARSVVGTIRLDAIYHQAVFATPGSVATYPICRDGCFLESAKLEG